MICSDSYFGEFSFGFRWREQVPEFRIERHTPSDKRETKVRIVSWGIVLSLIALPIAIVVLCYLGVRAGWNLRLTAAIIFIAAVIGASVLACREALLMARKEMLFILDDQAIIRKRSGFPDVRIAFSEVDVLSEELGVLIIKSAEPRRTIAVPRNVTGYPLICAELSKHHALSTKVAFPMKGASVMAAAVLGWMLLLSSHTLSVILPAAVVALTTLALSSRYLWNLLHRGRGRFLAIV